MASVNRPAWSSNRILAKSAVDVVQKCIKLFVMAGLGIPNDQNGQLFGLNKQAQIIGKPLQLSDPSPTLVLISALCASQSSSVGTAHHLCSVQLARPLPSQRTAGNSRTFRLKCVSGLSICGPPMECRVALTLMVTALATI